MGLTDPRNLSVDLSKRFLACLDINMIFRYSIRSILRSKGKTTLFALLISALTLALALAVSVWASVDQFLADADRFYTTIGLVEYMGTGYPDDSGYDAAMDRALASFDSARIADDTATLLWEEPTRSFGFVDGFWRTDNFMPDKMLSVLVVGNARYDQDNNLYNAIVMNSLYSFKVKADTIIYIDGDFGTFEPGHYYLVFGEVYYGASPLLHLRKASFNNAIAAARGVETPRMIDITADDSTGKYYEIPEASIFEDIAKTLPVTNNSVLVMGTDNLMALLPFHQQELYITDGRAFTEAEYSQGSQVAVISELMAARLGIGVGDAIDLSVAVSNYPGIYNSYWVEDGFSYRASFTVVGIMNTVNDKSWYVYVPKSAGAPSSPFPVGYSVGQAIIRNEDAPDFFARMNAILPERFQLTIYDQGYSTVAIPYQTILRVAKIATGVCLLVELAVILLFGFLFVYRQRDTGETMLMLGTGRKRVVGYFLFSSGAVALVAAVAGSVTGYWLHGKIIDLIAGAAANFALIDSRYSNGNLTISRTLEFAPELGWQLFLSVGAVVFFLAVLACLAFTVGTFLNGRSSQQKIIGPKREGRTSRLHGGSLKYALLSIARGGARSMVVPILAISVVMFFGQLASTSLRYQEQLDAIYDNTAIVGYYTDINGKQIGNQVLDAFDVGSLYRTGLLNELFVSIAEPYYYLGVSKKVDGTDTNIGPLYVPPSYFGFESLEASILRGPDLIATNNIRTAPEFFYANSIDLTFMDGYDESVLAVPVNDPKARSCIVTTDFMADQGISLGDTIRVAINQTFRSPEYKAQIFRHVDLVVVGAFEKQGVEDTIYAPLAVFFEPGLIWEPEQAAAGAPAERFASGYTIGPEQEFALRRTVFNSANFIIADSRGLIPLKNYLTEYGYSQVKKVSRVREFIVLEDAAFNNAVASVKQQIRYINTLYPFLYVLVGVISVIASYLLTVSRKKEFATMRGLGVPRAHSFFSFFFEQGMLCLLGTANGLLAWRLAWGQPSVFHLTLTGGFVVCYFLGCAISVMIMNYSNVLTILLDRD